jgi:hypothetical protein
VGTVGSCATGLLAALQILDDAILHIALRSSVILQMKLHEVKVSKHVIIKATCKLYYGGSKVDA